MSVVPDQAAEEPFGQDDTRPPAPSGTYAPTPSDRAVSLVAIRDGRVVITGSGEGELPPALIPDHTVVLRVKGEQVTRSVAVWEGLDIEIAPAAAARDPIRHFAIELDPDGMAAWLRLGPVGPVGWKIADAGPAYVVQVSAEPLPDRQDNPTFEQVEEAARSAGIVVTLDRQAIASAFADEGDVRVRIAVGQAPEPGIPGRLDTTIRDASEGEPAALEQRVEPGHRLARVIAPEPGRPGWDVFGRELHPDPPPDVQLLPGPGVCLADGGREAVASRPGRPHLIEVSPGMYQVSVIPVLEIEAVTAPFRQTARFDGDIAVRGSVGEGALLQASGWIWVQSTVYKARLEAGQGISVDRVQWGRLQTRTSRSILDPLSRCLEEMLSDLRSLRSAALQVLNHPRYSDVSRATTVGAVVRLLAEQRFRRIRNLVTRCRELTADLSWVEPPTDLTALMNTVEHLLYVGGVGSIADLDQLLEKVEAARAWTARAVQGATRSAPVLAEMMLGAEVSADGDVYVRGKGLELSAVTAAGDVQTASVRGGAVRAGHRISVEMVYGGGPQRARLEVPVGGRISIGRINQEVEVVVGHLRRILEEDQHNVLVEQGTADTIGLAVL